MILGQPAPIAERNGKRLASLRLPRRLPPNRRNGSLRCPKAMDEAARTFFDNFYFHRPYYSAHPPHIKKKKLNYYYYFFFLSILPSPNVSSMKPPPSSFPLIFSPASPPSLSFSLPPSRLLFDSPLSPSSPSFISSSALPPSSFSICLPSFVFFPLCLLLLLQHPPLRVDPHSAPSPSYSSAPAPIRHCSIKQDQTKGLYSILFDRTKALCLTERRVSVRSDLSGRIEWPLFGQIGLNRHPLFGPIWPNEVGGIGVEE